MTDVSVLKLADLRTVATETFSTGDATVRVYTKTAGIGMQLSRIGEQLREPENSKDPFAVAVVRSSVTVSQQLRTISIECARRPALLERGGRIRLAGRG